MACVHVSVGSNIDPARNVRRALDMLRERFGPLQVSPVYETRAVGFEGENFLNLVVGFETDDEPQAVADALREMEQAAGRVRGASPFAPRTLDLDLLLYDDLVLDAPGLRLPREEITRYGFVLRPLADIAGERRHPLTGQTFAELWAAFGDDPSIVGQVELDGQ